MKQFLYKLWNGFVGILEKLRRDRLYHFIFGLLIALLAVFICKWYFFVWTSIAVGLAKEFFDKWQDGNFDWIDLLATTIGGLVVQVLVWCCVTPGVPFL